MGQIGWFDGLDVGHGPLVDDMYVHVYMCVYIYGHVYIYTYITIYTVYRI